MVHEHGPAEEVQLLVRSMARSVRAPLRLGLDDGRRGRTVGASTVTILPGTGPGPTIAPLEPTSWRFTLADLEGVV